MSLKGRVNIPIHATDELALSYAPLSHVGQQATFLPEETNNLYEGASEHPETSHLVSGATPWVCATPSPSSPSDDYVAATYKCVTGTDMDAVEAAMAGTEPFFIDRDTFNSTTGRVTAYIDASAVWNLEEWTDCSIAFSPRWSAIKLEVLHPGSELVCTLPTKNSSSFKRKVIPLLAGQSITIEPEGEHCHFLSLFSPLSKSDGSFKKKRLIPLTSNSPVLTAEQDTILVKLYR